MRQLDEVHHVIGNATTSRIDSGKSGISSAKKEEQYAVERTDIDILKEVVASLTEADFIEVPDDYGNILTLNPDDFPTLAEESRGSPVVMILRGAIKGLKEDGPCCGTMDAGVSSARLEIYLFNAALVHGDKSMRLGGGGRFAKMEGALKREGYSAESAGAIAASLGRKKYGKKRFQKMAAAGLRRLYREEK